MDMAGMVVVAVQMMTTKGQKCKPTVDFHPSLKVQPLPFGLVGGRLCLVLYLEVPGTNREPSWPASGRERGI